MRYYRVLIITSERTIVNVINRLRHAMF